VELEIDVNERDGHTVVAVGGEIDAYTAPSLQSALDEVIPDRGVQVVVDLSDVDFLDSTGLGVLVNALNRARTHDGELSLVVTSDRVRRIFEISSLTELFALHGTLDAALGRDGDG
jgi:anti-sigma B factor antagonist